MYVGVISIVSIVLTSNSRLFYKCLCVTTRGEIQPSLHSRFRGLDGGTGHGGEARGHGSFRCALHLDGGAVPHSGAWDGDGSLQHVLEDRQHHLSIFPLLQ